MRMICPRSGRLDAITPDAGSILMVNAALNARQFLPPRQGAHTMSALRVLEKIVFSNAY
jgi:hypothetical protein